MSVVFVRYPEQTVWRDREIVRLEFIEPVRGEVPFFLSGGIAWENREEIGKIKHPKLAGLDLNSRFETAPGMKNIHLLSRFLAELP
ncbi:hypothetical protein KSZ83_02955 [Odoribacter splanchnicus]|nr:hypothetical protein [Odoribacter splanchnicus]MBV4398977.1 hypothetical protein [Odoribacter splanchnicus]MBV4407634.1 hypothetical protein [Odoribacter splanchnicus]